MGINTTAHQAGFLEYGSNDPDVIGFASLTSSSNLDIGVHSPTVTEGDGVTYTEDGVLIGATTDGGARITYPNSLALLLKNGGTITYWIEKGFFEDASIGAESHLIYINGTDKVFIRKLTITDGIIQTKQASGLSNTLNASNVGMDDLTRVDISFNNKGISMYVDYLLLMKNDWAANPAFDSTINLSGLGTSGAPNAAFRFKNMQVSTRPISLPVNPQVIDISVLGDSFTRQGQYPLNNCFYTGYAGADYGDTSLDPLTTHRNRGMLPTIHSELAKKNTYIGDRVNFYGRGTSEVFAASGVPLSARTDAMDNQASVEYPTPSVRKNTQIVVSVIGTNDIANSRDQATVLADYKTEIDKWDVYASHIVITTIPDRYSPASKSDAAGLAEIASMNELYKTLEDYNSKVKVVDMNPIMDSTDFISDGIHPDTSGMVKYGKQIANAIYGAI